MVEGVGRGGWISPWIAAVLRAAFAVLGAAFAAGCAEGDSTGGPLTGAPRVTDGRDASDGASDVGLGREGGVLEAGDAGALVDAGGDARANDAAVTDGTAAPDVAESAICKAYCECMATTCPGYLPGDCKVACAGLTLPAASCRLDHCQNAGSDPATHCPHAIGVGYCQ